MAGEEQGLERSRTDEDSIRDMVIQHRCPGTVRDGGVYYEAHLLIVFSSHWRLIAIRKVLTIRYGACGCSVEIM